MNYLFNLFNDKIKLIKVFFISIPLYYANFIIYDKNLFKVISNNEIFKNICTTYTINNIYLYYLYSNKDYLINSICFRSIYYPLLLYSAFYIVPLLYFMLFNINIIQTMYVINIYLYEVINNQNIILKYIKYIMNFILDNILNIKIFINNFYKSCLNNNFIMTKILLYTDIDNFIDITSFFNNNIISRIDRNLIDVIYKEYGMNNNKNKDTRLKIYFKFQQIEYIVYFPYEITVDKDLNEYYLPYPIYNKDIMDKMKNDIILPYYKDEKSKKQFYSLFHIESKDILLTCINDIHDKELCKYFNLIKTPFNDFGILYNVPVKLHWILVENNVDINTFDNLYFKFLSVYFCEKEFDIKEHSIIMYKNDLDKVFISERMKEIIKF